MKVSKYTFCLKTGKDDFLLFSTLSNALIGVDEETFRYLKRSQQMKSEVSENQMDAELFEVLKEKHLITENDLDETLLFKSSVQAMRMDRTSMHLTIAPTMDCIFRCHYCFEQHKSRSYMTSETIDAIIRYLTGFKEVKCINLTWFGGEPLMATQQMEEFYTKLKSDFPHKIVSNIITTGYHLSEETIHTLKSIRVSSVQITLDGSKESHNKIKYLSDCSDVFSRILDNADRLTASAPDLNVVFRINLTQQNKHEYVGLYRLLSTRYKNRNVAVAPGFVMNRHAGRSNTEGKLYFSRKEASEFVLDLFKNYGIHSPWLRYPQATCNECAIRNSNSVSFDADGYAYKCWEVIGDRRYAVGKIASGKGLTDISPLMLNRQLYGADPLCDNKCLKCRLLPICYGGCPIQRIQNRFEGYRNEVCTPYKGYLAKYLAIHFSLKKAGIENY